MNKRTVSMATGAVLAVLAVGACSTSADTPPPAEEAVSSPSDAQSPTAASPTPTETDATADATDTAADSPISGPLDATSAAERALQVVPGVVVELGVGRESGTDVWEVGVLAADGTGTEIYLDRATGDVVRQKSLRLSSEQRTAPAVTATEAIATAVATVPGSVVELDLDTHRSAVVWEVLVSADAGGRYELYIDATTGSVVKQERDD